LNALNDDESLEFIKFSVSNAGAYLYPKLVKQHDIFLRSDRDNLQIIAFIKELDIIEKILRHLDLWDVRNHDPPQKISDYILELVCDEADTRIPELEHWY